MIKHVLGSILISAGSLFPAVYAQQKLPDVVPPSPQSMNFQKFGDYPVTYNNGLPDISIPLYTIKSGELEMPIVLRYHSAGIKPLELDLSSIGAGWTLDVGGTVSRMVKGRPDELFQRPSTFLSKFQIDQNTSSGIAYLDNILTNRNVDVEYDKFTYSFLGYYGNFAIDNNGNGTYSAYTYPFVPYKFDVQTAAPTDPKYYKSIAGIDVTDDKGVKYKFGHVNVELANVTDDYAPTTWFLEDMSNHENTNHITIDYASVPVFSSTPVSSSTGVTDNGVQVGAFGGTGICTNTQQVTWGGNCSQQGQLISYNTKCIDVIHFKNGYVKFNFDGAKRFIGSLAIYDNNNVLIKSFVFNRDNFPGSSTFYRLNSIEEKDNGNNTVDKYGFTYFIVNGSNGTPLADNNCDIDYWGYCKGEGGGPKCPYRTISVIDPPVQGAGYVHNIQIGNEDLTPNDSYAQRFLLTKIQYPTGGTTAFTFEGNKYLDYTPGTGTPVTLNGGGLRIKKITSTDNLNGTTSKSYEYEPGFIEYSFFNENNVIKTSYNVANQCVNPNDLFTPIYYQYRNRAYSAGTNSDLGDNRVYYKVITEYVGDATNNQGKTVYTYKYENPNPNVTAVNLTTNITDFRNWGNGLLYTKEVYKNMGNNNYLRINRQTSNYEFVFAKILTNLKASMASTYYGGNGNTPGSNYMLRNDLISSYGFSTSQLPPPCFLYDYTITTGAYYLKSSVEDTYADNGAMTVSTQYKHANPANYYVTEASVDQSDGSLKITRRKYPQDLTDALSQTMVSKNIFSPAVEETTFKSVNTIETLLTTTQNIYGQFGNVIAPNQIKTSVGSNATETRIQFNQYDIYGNILEQQKANDVKEVYLWGYNSQFPVAKIVGSDYATASQYVDQNVLNSPSNDASLRTALNSLRVNLPNALVTTYTYAPLTGITSLTDPSGKTTYYEYDRMGRLKDIKDLNGNIIKTYDYHYQGQ